MTILNKVWPSRAPLEMTAEQYIDEYSLLRYITGRGTLPSHF